MRITGRRIDRYVMVLLAIAASGIGTRVSARRRCRRPTGPEGGPNPLNGLDFRVVRDDREGGEPAPSVLDLGDRLVDLPSVDRRLLRALDLEPHLVAPDLDHVEDDVVVDDDDLARLSWDGEHGGDLLARRSGHALSSSDAPVRGRGETAVDRRTRSRPGRETNIYPSDPHVVKPTSENDKHIRSPSTD